MAKNRVIIVDPSVPRREEYVKHLRLKFDVHVVSDQKAAMKLFSESPPDAVAISFRQRSGHGLEVCKSLRAQGGGRDCFFMVYGEGPKKEEARKAAIERFGVDSIISRALDGEAMEKVLSQEITSWRRSRRTAAQDEAKKAASSSSPSSWSDLLKADLSLKNIRSVFQR